MAHLATHRLNINLLALQQSVTFDNVLGLHTPIGPQVWGIWWGLR
jgi:hypothetical protein